MSIDLRIDIKLHCNASGLAGCCSVHALHRKCRPRLAVKSCAKGWTAPTAKAVIPTHESNSPAASRLLFAQFLLTMVYALEALATMRSRRCGTRTDTPMLTTPLGTCTAWHLHPRSQLAHQRCGTASHLHSATRGSRDAYAAPAESGCYSAACMAAARAALVYMGTSSCLSVLPIPSS